ncbi:DUF4097 family beta strand repeat-containing protein [Nocardiopsis aegyptia]|uniref:DUF4097 and DUF4098 domain-containing protein YvlB n=1 Tax=Nocardiopsis aegyptia TaxID=220378 RepID=A0A7Z0JAP1_9ACTN|nr:DUF4097 family beta strand repeat-containing protein [Nocardiopsis aegyptia]NYJ34624.1 DUF4097 and DUF4098 domain-containing protein YvlB [Nocardiopsis aegyptia]
MPTFDTPEPITADLTVVAGNLQITAGGGTETTVEVRPRAEHKDVDVRAAEQVEVDFAGGRLEVRDPQPSGLGRVIGRKGMVDITVELPAGSRVRATCGFGGIRCEGRLGAAEISVPNGNITVDAVSGNAELTTGHGWVRAEEIDGSAVVKSTGGALTLGTVAGDLRANSAHGDVTADRVGGSVTARTTHGGIRLGQVEAGSVDVETSYGELEIGVREGTAAWLDAVSKKGVVRSALEASDAPAPTERTVEVRARSVWGDILVRRS